MRKRNFIWVMLIVLLPVLACSLGGSKQGGEAAPATQAGATEAAAATEPATAELAATEPATAEPATAEPAATEPAAAAGAGQGGDSAPAESGRSGSTTEGQGGTEAQSTKFSGATSLEKLSSYRVEFLMNFDGQSGGKPAKGEVKMAMEETKSPPARHLTMAMSGTITEQTGGMNNIEVFYIDDKVYMKNAAMGESGWISFSGDEAATFGQGFFAPDQQLEVPKTATCDPEPVTINGISATHCTFNEKDIASDEATVEHGQGEAWVATEGNYIVKLTFKGEGYQPKTKSEGDLFDYGSVSYDYNVKDINNVSISLPEEAKKAIDMGAAGGGQGGGETKPADTGDIPVLANAQDVVNMGGFVTYTTTAAIADILTFYRQELGAAGWKENSEEAYTDDTTAIVSFGKEGKTFRLTVTTEDKQRTVMATVE